MLSEYVILISVGFLFGGGLLSLFFPQKPRISIGISFTGAGLAALGGLGVGIGALITGEMLTFELPWRVLGNALSFSVDALSAFFLVVISVVCLAVAIFSFGYVAGYSAKHHVGFLGLFFNLFVISMMGVVTGSNFPVFLFFWELMSLVSFFLVIFEHHVLENRKAGYIYAVMTHTGTLFITGAFLLLYKETGSFSFQDMAVLGNGLAAPLKSVVFLFAAIGFGTKAGAIPLHIWLPRAHPSAPSNVSAIMSGVMIKTALYGLVRVVFDILGGGPGWWGGVLLAVGVVSALLGVMYALMEHDLKRLLAYHSVENIGIILMGMGAALILSRAGHPQLAMVALAAGLFHILNHALFKALLFLGAGSLQHAVGTKDLEKMGGLLKRMPWTGLFFLIGALAISAIPPFNGFVSEWLVFQALLLLGFGKAGAVYSILGPLSGAALALTGALAATCFVKAFGIPFLALPRSPEARNAVEIPISMRIGMGLLAGLCVIFGIFPTVVFRLLDPVTRSLLDVGILPSLGSSRWLQVASPLQPGTGISPISLFLVLILAAAVVFAVIRIFGWKGPVRRDETWNCGTDLTPEMEYSALSFSKPVRIIFRKIYQPRRQITKEFKHHPYFVTSIKYSGSIKPVFEDLLYAPAARFLIWAANSLRVLQSGSIHLYLAYIFGTLLVLLLVFVR